MREANGSNIDTYGRKSLTLEVGMHRGFSWIFTEADFLANFKESVNIANQILINSQTKFSIRGSQSRYISIGINSVLLEDKIFQALL